MQSIDSLFKQGCKAVREKNYEQARKLLRQVIEQDNQHKEAWLWFALAMPTPEKRRKYLERALQIDPNYTDAQKLLQQLSAENVPTPVQSASTKNVAPISTQPALTSSDTGLGAELLHTKTSWKNQFQRLFVIVLLSIVIGYMILQTEFPLYLQLAIAERSLFVETVWFDFVDFLLFAVFVGGIIYSLYEIFVAFGQELIVYQNGIKHRVFGDEREWQWTDFKVGKVTNRLVQNRMAGIPMSKTHTFKIVLHSDKGKLVISDVFENHVHVGQTVAELASSQVPFVLQERHPILRLLSK
jgi:hypothetical protein